eukprot:jgi/Sobl393_1/7395/SZX61668.1
MSWNLRVRGPGGQATLAASPDTAISQLQQQIEEKLGVPVHLQELLGGFPPKQLQITDPAATLSSVGIANGDSLTVRQAAAPAEPPAATPAASGAAAGLGLEAVEAAAAAAGGDGYAMDDEDEDAQLAAAIAASLQDSQPAAATTAAPPAAAATAAAAARLAAAPRPPQPSSSKPAPAAGQTPSGAAPAPTSVRLADGSCVVRRIIPSDNSCLFTAVGYVMEHDRGRAAALRQVIAEVVAADPVTYNDGFLGKTNEEYCEWITNKKNWGGGIELAILSAHYGREIAAFDIRTKRCDRYGESEGYAERVLLIYDGLHYDAMAVAAFEGAPEELDITVLQ